MNDSDDHIRNHPIFNNHDFFIKTLMINGLKQKLTGWLWNGLSGGAVYGRYRIGKTKAIKHVTDELVNRINEKIPFHHFTITTRDIGTIAGVFRNLCHSFNFEIKSRITADEMSNLIIHRLGEMSMINRTRQVLLIADEFQRLNVRQLDAFAELHDGLINYGVNLFALFVGNETDSRALMKQLMGDKNELIRGRFFTQSYLYHGIRNSEEINYCLQQYDDMKYPDDGQSYTQAFLSDVAPSDWKLSSLSNIVWNVYLENYQKPLKLSSWPMQYFVSMVRVLLTDYLPRYGVDDLNLVSDLIEESINASGLVDNIVQE